MGIMGIVLVMGDAGFVSSTVHYFFDCMRWGLPVSGQAGEVSHLYFL